MEKLVEGLPSDDDDDDEADEGEAAVGIVGDWDGARLVSRDEGEGEDSEDFILWLV